MFMDFVFVVCTKILLLVSLLEIGPNFDPYVPTLIVWVDAVFSKIKKSRPFLWSRNTGSIKRVEIINVGTRAQIFKARQPKATTYMIKILNLNLKIN